MSAIRPASLFRLFSLITAIVLLSLAIPVPAQDTEAPEQAETAPTPNIPVPHIKPSNPLGMEDDEKGRVELTKKQAERAEEERQAREELQNSLLSLSLSLADRQERLAQFIVDMDAVTDESSKAALEQEIADLRAEILTVEEEIDIVVLGLQSREYGSERTESEAFNLNKEIGEIFQPLVISLERATEPSRRLEELRQLLEKVERRRQIADATLENISRFRRNGDGEAYPRDVEARLLEYENLWTSRLQEAIDVGTALERQLEVANRAKGNTLTTFAEYVGGFVINRGMSLLLALGAAFSFLTFCQLARIRIAQISRERHSGVLHAPIRILSLVITAISIVGALIIAMTIFNLRHDWLMLAFSLLFALALAWSFMRALPTIVEESRVLLNLGSVREGERVVVDGVPYRIEKLSWYSTLVNPALTGGVLTYPVKTLVNMHSRPAIACETWFPTQTGDWIVRDGKHYFVAEQTPEHVIIRRPGGHEDFVPTLEYLDTVFEVISKGYRRSHSFGLSYKHLAQASEDIPRKMETAISKRITKRIGKNNLLNLEVLLTDLGDSALMFSALADIGSDQGQHWEKIKSDIANGVVDACLEEGWEIPFPQLVIHKEAD